MTNELIGTIRSDGKQSAVRLERTYDIANSDLWSAVTEPDRLRRWFAQVRGDLTEGGSYEIVFDDEPDAPTHGTILECQPPHHLLVSWHYPHEEESFVRVDLEPDGSGTRLVLEHTRMPQSLTVNYGAGWQTFLEQLDADLHGRDGKGPEWNERWKQLQPAYQAQLT